MSDDLRTPPAATSTALLAVLDVARYGAREGSDIPLFKDRYARVRLATDRDWPPRVWPYLNEIFYAVEEHYQDPRLREEHGGLDDAGLRRTVASQVPALSAEYQRMRAEEEGRPLPDPPLTASAREISSALLATVRAFLAGSLDEAGFTTAFRRQRARAGDQLPPRVLAAVETIRHALDALVSEGQARRLYDLDEHGLRVRVADVEPRLADAVAEL